MLNAKNKFIFLMSALALVAILFLSGCAPKEKGTQQFADENAMVDCSDSKDPSCFVNRMTQCLPVTAKMAASDSSTTIDITILGQVNDTCHFQRKINDVLNLDCYFPRGTLNMDTLDQTFGNDKGLKSVVDSACKMAGW
jgi:hypothetical protein